MEAAKSLEELRSESKTLDYYTKFLFITPAEETKTAQKKILRYFFNFIDIEGEDLKEKFNKFCANGLQNSLWAEDKIYDYLIELVRLSKLPKTDPKRIAAGTIKNRKMVLRKLLKVAKIPFDWELVNPTLPKVTKNSSKDRAYTLDEIHTMCKYPDLRIVPVVYVSASAGLRLGAWNYLKVKHVKPITDKKSGKITCAQIEVYEDEDEGEEYTYRTLITKEAYDKLQEWIEFRKKSGEKVTGESWLMRDLWDTKAGFTHGVVSEPYQLKASGVKSLIDSALRRTGLRVNLPVGKKRHEVMLTHGFKKWRETALVKTGMPEINLNTLMGHGNPGMIDYYNRPDLVEEFLKAENYLIIDEANRDLDELKKEVKQEVTAVMKNDYEQQIKDLRKEWLFTKFSEVIEDMIEENPQRVITPEQQLQYFIENKPPRITELDIELIKEMIRDNEITTYYEETEKEIEFTDEVQSRYNYYKVFPDEDSHTEEFDQSTGNLIVKYDDDSKQSFNITSIT